VRADGLPDERFAPAVEEAAYLAIANLADQWAPAPLAVSAAREGERLVVDVRTPAGSHPDVVEAEDRVGALGGSVAVRLVPHGGTRVTVELPCA
jgi:hypothetical protein